MIRKLLLPFLCCVPLCSFGVTVGDLRYDIYDYNPWGTGMAAVSSNTIGIKGDISIPGGISTGGVQFNVTKVADSGFQGCVFMTSISLPPTLTHIGTRAFYICTGLTKVSFSYSSYDPLTFGNEVFSKCTSLREITLPETTTSIGDYTFSNCTNLKSVTFPSSLKKIGNYSFTGCNHLVDVHVSSVEDWCKTEIGNFEASPFSHNGSAVLITNGTRVTSVKPSSNTCTIGKYCFAGNCTLTSVELHENFNSLGEGCFQYARNISEITSLSQTPPSIGKYCFDGVSKSIPVHVPAAALNAYRQADGWKDFNNYVPIITETPERFTEWGIVYSTIGMPTGECAVIGYDDLQADYPVYIGNTARFGGIQYKVTKIAESAFEKAPFPRIELPSDNLREIGNRAFYSASIEEMEIPNGTVSIGDEAFAWCYHMESLRIRSTDLNSIGDYAFLKCSALRSVNIPGSLDYLGTEAFRECTSLKKLEISNGLKSIRQGTFMSIPIESIVLPESLGMIGANAFLNCENLRDVLITAPQVYISGGVFWHCPNLKQVCIVSDQILGTDQKPFNSGGINVFLNSPVYNQFKTQSIWKDQNLEMREITINQENLDFPKDLIGSFTYQVNDADIVNQSINWYSSDESIFTYSDRFNSSGTIVSGNYLYPHQTGSANLIGEGKYGLSISRTVKVCPTATDLFLSTSDSTTKLNIGDIDTIRLKPVPSDAFIEPEWSVSDATVISIEEYLDDSRAVVIKALKEGFTRITVSSGKLSTYLTITVMPRPEKVWLSVSQAEIKIDETLWLAAGISPDKADQSIIWSSSDPDIASVSDDGSGNGYCKGVAPGECIIKATSVINPEVLAECFVTVKANVDSIIVNPSKLSMKVGESFELTANVLPENAAYQELSWSSSDENVVISQDNVIYAVSPGNADITVSTTDGRNISAICHVTVEPIKVESIMLSPYKWNGKPGETFQIIPRIYPENATDKHLVWISDAEEIATVDSVGIVSALRPGKATVSATAADGSKAGAICLVTVEPILVESISLTPDSWEGEEGEAFPIKATILPDEASDKTLIWTSSNDAVATVDSNGLVNVLSPGECIIIASSADGSDVMAQCVILSVSGVEEVLDMNGEFDIYTLSGTLIKHNADKDFLKHLTPSVYVLRSAKSSTTVILH